MPRETDLFEQEDTMGFKPLDPNAAAPTGVNTEGLLPEEDTTPTEAENAQYQQVVLKAGQIIDGENTSDGIIEKMNDPTKPVHVVVGNVAAMIGKTIIGLMEAAGEEPEVVVILSAAEDYVIPKLFELGQAAKVLPQMKEAEEQKEMNLAFLHAEQVYGNQQAKAGRLPTQEARSLLDAEFTREGKGYSLDQFIKDSGMPNEPANTGLPDSPAPMGPGPGGAQLNPIMQGMANMQGGSPGDLFGG